MKSNENKSSVAPSEPRARKILRASEVKKLDGKSRVQRWRDVRDGRYPAPVQLGPNSIGWFEDEIVAHLESLPRVNYAPAEAKVARDECDALSQDRETPTSGPTDGGV